MSADFAGTTYDWVSMPGNVTSSNSAVATLMYHCGVGVDMNYGVGSQGGSGAYVISSKSPVTNCAEYAMKQYFGYPTDMQGIVRENYSDDQWVSTLKSELDAGRPILYAGFGSGGGGGGGGGSGTTYNLQLYANITLSSSSIYYGEDFTVHTDIANGGTNNFQGDYCAAVFDNTYAFVEFVEILSGQDLPAGYHYTNGLTFSNPGTLSILPGTYYIGIYYRPTGGNWYQVADNGGYYNWVQIDVVNPNDIELYQPMSVTPGTTLVRRGPISVHLDVGNYGSTTFSGTLDVSLYDIEGNFVETIEEMTGMVMPPSTHYTNWLTFYTSSLNAEPGTYLMAILHKPDGSDWELTGSTYYQNPIKVTVQEEAIYADVYEPNNTVSQSSLLNMSFSGNEGIVTTAGSNCHTGIDYDLYKTELQPGYSYSVGARLFDATFGNNGTTYPLDAMFMYSTDGVNGSEVYDEMIPDNFTLNIGGTVWFQVSPKYTGETGTYLLSINVGKYPLGTDPATEAENITVYPNPASDMAVIDLTAFTGTVSQVEVVNITGQVLLTKVINREHKTLRVDVTGSPNGLYTMKFHTKEGILSKRIVVQR